MKKSSNNVKAFKFSALDYLLKPIDPTELLEAVAKVETEQHAEIIQIKYATLLSNFKKMENQQTLILKTSEKIFSVNIQDIVCCSSEKNHTTFHLSNFTNIVASKTLKEYEFLLSDLGFF